MGRPRKNKVVDWEGTAFYLRKNGYFCSDNGVYLHRAIWEKHHGKIPDGCDIHHKDGDKASTVIDNLEAIPHGRHARLHHLGRKRARKHPCYCGEKHHAKGLCRRHYKRLWWRINVGKWTKSDT